MSILITTVFLVLVTTVNAKPAEHENAKPAEHKNAKPAEHEKMKAVDSNPERSDICFEQHVQELEAIRHMMASMSQKYDTDMNSVYAGMSSMSQKHRSGINKMSQLLHKAQEKISTLEELVQSDTDKQKTSEVYPSPDTSPGNNKMLQRDTGSMKNLINTINNEANNTLLQANINQDNQGLSTGVVAFYARIAGYTGSPSEMPPILYDLVDLNLGGAYDALSGQFTAPVAGIYSLSYEALADSSCGTNYICFILSVNSVQVSHSCSEVNVGGGSTVNVQMAVGDVAWVGVNEFGPCYVLHSGDKYNKFTGHLVYKII